MNCYMSWVEKTIKEINEIQKIENKEKTKTINVISSKVDKQIFFDVIDKIQDEETQKKLFKIFLKFNSQWRFK